jgi:hypothetical protein
VGLAITSSLLFESGQLQSAQVRVVLARTNAIIIRSEHYELVAMLDPRGQNFACGATQCTLANYVKFFALAFAKGRQKRWERSMKSICGIALVLGLLSQTTNSMADYAIMGPGSVTCGKFAADYRQNPDQVDNLFFTWAQGFMSGFNITETTGTYRDMTAVPIDAQKKFILNYCDQHPSLEYAKAVMELYHYKLPLKKTPPASSR